jgi:hypothetical protein
MRYGLLLVLVLIPACGSGTKVVSETWQATYLQGARIGHTHTRVTESGGVITLTRSIRLTVKRYGSVLPIEIEQTCTERSDGSVLTLGLNQSLGKDKQTSMTARVEGKKLFIKTGSAERRTDWDESCLGLYAQEQAFVRNKSKPGDTFRLSTFELSAEIPLGLKVTLKPAEEVDRLVLKDETIQREKVNLVRAEIVSDKLWIGGKETQLPPKTVWLDDEGHVIREQFEFPGLGMVTQYTTSKEAATHEAIAPDLLPDLGMNIMIPLNKEIANPYETQQAIYRIKADVEGGAPFAQDERQQIKLPLGKTFELWVQSVRGPGDRSAKVPTGKEFAEYIEPNRFIDSDNERIKTLARTIVGNEKQPYEMAIKLEKGVHDRMQFDAGVGFPPASQTAREFRGDCRQHALLLAALLRASGIPSRTALGVIYTREPGKGPVFAFHMWTEAYVGGRWLALDAIQGKGFVGATHLTMVHHSWAGTQTLAPLLPIAGVLGKLKIEVTQSR